MTDTRGSWGKATVFPKQNQEPITFTQQMFFIMNLINHMKQPPNFWFPGKPEPQIKQFSLNSQPVLFIKKTHIYFKLEISYLFGNIKFQRDSKWWKAGLSMKNKISLLLSFMTLNKNSLVASYTCCK